MPRAFLTFIGFVTGYLNGAGLGALLLSFYPSTSTLPDFKLLLIAGLILGPLGALVGASMMLGGTYRITSGNLSEER